MFTDARDYLDAQGDDLDEDEVQMLERDSGIAELDRAIQQMISDSAGSPRAQAQCFEVGRLIDEGDAAWAR